MAKKQNSSTPGRRMCGASEAHQRLCECDPGFRQRRSEIHLQCDGFIQSGRAFKSMKAGKIRTIPVVVHIVYRTAAENISDAQIRSQIEALNRDYSATNPDKATTPAPWQSLVVDTLVRFVLATKDANGKATTGITRTKTKVATFGSNDTVKSTATGGANAWPTDQFLNLWVCSLGGGLLGYAQFPGGPVATDGVVILNTAFGTVGTAAAPFDLGRTAVHEVGHWLNLNHIWGDSNDCSGTDHISDTPHAKLPNFGTPTFPHITCRNGPNGDMFVNYMDYVDDAAMVMFTHGQVARMHSTLVGPRHTLGV